jgi:hypothetical protein
VAETPVLYVKLAKIAQVEWTMPHHDYYCSAGYRAAKTDMILNEEDQRAIEVLEKAGLKYVLIDLSLETSLNRVIARIRGVNATPTLIYKGQKLEGLQQITSALETTAKP